MKTPITASSPSSQRSREDFDPEIVDEADQASSLSAPISRVPRMSQPTAATAPTTHAKLLDWVGAIGHLTQPHAVHWCDGSAEEYDALAQALIDAGTFERLSD